MELQGQIKPHLKLLNYILSEHDNNSVNYLVLLVLIFGMMVTLIYSSCGEYIVHACSASTQLWYISSTVKGIKLLNPEGYKDDGVYK